jgi:hypothetical protein
MTDGQTFRDLMMIFEQNYLQYDNIYDHPDKSGIPLALSVVFLGEKPLIKVFEFRYGTETKDLGDIAPYFAGYIQKAIEFSDDWYYKSIREIPTQSLAAVFNVVDAEESIQKKKQEEAQLITANEKKWWQFWK